MSNALAGETSPYLRQHKDNPVDWLPWGPEAHRRAVELDRPLLVSIGYSACHWCHVMEHESFEDAATAALMNANFVCVKVDREERPDVDAIYMEAVQNMTGQGGWPLNVFLTPDQTPFYGGTYFPPTPRHGLPSWPQLLEAIARTWRERREDAVETGARLAQRVVGGARLEPAADPIDSASLEQAIGNLRRTYDARRGGFGRAPKFPPASTIEFLLGHGEAEMSLHTLRAMASGGINDQVGGGFARYAVDATWTVPHFEKMLYDNALLARAYLHGWQCSGDELLLRTCRETLEFCLRELRAPEGGFYAALDADSEGVEGRFYVWSVGELDDVLGELAEEAIAYFGASRDGNFDGANVLEARGPEPDPARRAQIRDLLLARRADRVRPGLDDKRLTSWNALIITALAEAGAVLEEPRYIDAATACADFVLGTLRDADGRLLRTFNAGQARLGGYLEDHAFLLEALVALYEATFDEGYFVEARSLADEIIDRFADPERGGFFSTPTDHEALIARRKDLEDTPIPSGSSSAALGLLRLAALTGVQTYEDAAAGAIQIVHRIAADHPGGFGHLLQAVEFIVGSVREVAVVGEPLDPLVRVIRGRLRPGVVLAGSRGATDMTAVPLLEGRLPVDGAAAAYVCESFACRAPVTTPAALAGLLDG
ncbi:MAG TPA: thioredoxin domain-containing protein [Solirubrobacteraceae bacterium]|nr:thioredoxin domain-containing protein [Solirubrobacteraceae bacterium]